MLYRDHYQVKKAFEQNNAEAKNEHQISDETRTNLKVDPALKCKDHRSSMTGRLLSVRNCGHKFQ